ncbi:hypothetical protein HYPSUDRAFT_209881 [Hypholoma sublateritium FD-334 SS-4]|uniref:Uncharacterized protein n=1 Tax=Hypholoma sublateritium (strain FD-334 SS-4) TaxID=945553 RepID=A0A0D2LQD8_HYPSF|nr:hypothetical protein HYPSUDRAFT_209881 [Hypholoma sublateritium FD-334 SS-4]
MLRVEWFNQHTISDYLQKKFGLFLIDYLRNLGNYFALGKDDDLRNILKLSGALISGSCALLPLHPDLFTPNDIDFYVDNTAKHFILRKFLAENRYALILEHTSLMQPAYPQQLVHHVKLHHNKEHNKVVQIICSKKNAAANAIIDFHSTVVMNFISADGLVSLYPNETLSGHGIRLQSTANAEMAFNKYTARGFVLHPQCNLERNDPIYNLTDLHDKSTLFLPFLHADRSTLQHMSWILPFRPVDTTQHGEPGLVVNESGYPAQSLVLNQMDVI